MGNFGRLWQPVSASVSKLFYQGIQTFDYDNRPQDCRFRSLAWSPATSMLYALDTHGGTTKWDIATQEIVVRYRTGRNQGQEIRTYSERPIIRDRTFSRLYPVNHEQLLIVNPYAVVGEYSIKPREDVPRWKVVSESVGPKPQLANVQDNDQQFVVMDQGGTLTLFDAADDKIIWQDKNAHDGQAAEICRMSNNRFVTVGGDRVVRIWQLDNDALQLVREIETNDAQLSVAVHEERDLLSCVSTSNVLTVRQLSTEQLVHREVIMNTSGPILTGKCAFSRTGKYLIAFGSNQSRAILDTDSWKHQSTRGQDVAGQGGYSICFSPIIEEHFCALQTIVAEVAISRVPLN